MHLYEYACSRSINVLDPTGLFSLTSFVKRVDKSLPFTIGSFLGSMLAAQQLEPEAELAFKFAKFAGSWAAKKTIGLALGAATRPDKPLLWQAMHQNKSPSLFGGGIIKDAIMFLWGVAYGQTAYAMWTITEDLYHGEASYLPGF